MSDYDRIQMGTSSSKHAEVTDTGVVNSNFIVEQEAIAVPEDIRILLYILVAVAVLLAVLKLHKAYRRVIKKEVTRNQAVMTA